MILLSFWSDAEASICSGDWARLQQLRFVNRIFRHFGALPRSLLQSAGDAASMQGLPMCPFQVLMAVEVSDCHLWVE